MYDPPPLPTRRRLAFEELLVTVPCWALVVVAWYYAKHNEEYPVILERANNEIHELDMMMESWFWPMEGERYRLISV